MSYSTPTFNSLMFRIVDDQQGSNRNSCLPATGCTSACMHPPRLSPTRRAAVIDAASQRARRGCRQPGARRSLAVMKCIDDPKSN